MRASQFSAIIVMLCVVLIQTADNPQIALLWKVLTIVNLFIAVAALIVEIRE